MQRRKKFAIIFISLSAIFAVMTGVGFYILGKLNVKEIQGISIYSEDGVNVVYDMYIPSMPVSTPSPLIVVVHGLGMNRRQMHPFALTLAADGYYVIAPDHRGHGSASGTLSYNETAGAQDVLAAIKDAIRRLGNKVNASSIVLIGHSMGGGIVTVLGSMKNVTATIGIAPVPEEWAVNTTTPHNFLLVTGKDDGAISLKAHEELFRKMINSTEFEYGKIYGNMSEGTARMFYLDPDSNHATEMLDPSIYRVVKGWIADTTGTTPRDYSVDEIFLASLLATSSPVPVVFFALLTVLSHYRRRREEDTEKSEEILDIKKYIQEWFKWGILLLPVTVVTTFIGVAIIPLFYGAVFIGVLFGLAIPTVFVAKKYEHIRNVYSNFDRYDILIGVVGGTVITLPLIFSFNSFLAPPPSLYMIWAHIILFLPFSMVSVIDEAFFHPIRVHFKRKPRGLLISSFLNGTLHFSMLTIIQTVLALIIGNRLFILVGVGTSLVFFFLALVSGIMYAYTNRPVTAVIMKSITITVLAVMVSCRIDFITVLFNILGKT